jgi:hypothetical protein
LDWRQGVIAFSLRDVVGARRTPGTNAASLELLHRGPVSLLRLS